MKNVYLIDYENVGAEGLKGAENLTTKDEIILFHYEGAGDVRYKNLISLAGTRAATKIIKLKSHEKNAMDFQIVTMLSHYVTLSGNKATYHIVSKDKGYNAAIECILENLDNRVVIDAIPSISNRASNKELAIRETLKTLSPKQLNRVISIYKRERNLNDLHCALQKQFPREFNIIYKAVKPLYLAS